jgi:hypothetical protein
LDCAKNCKINSIKTEQQSIVNKSLGKGRRNVNKKYVYTSVLLIIAALVVTAGCGDSKLTVLNPAIESKMVDREPLSPRLDTLDGKTIYMVDINWGGPDAAWPVFEEMTAWFAQNMPTVKTVIKKKAGMYSMDDQPLWKEISEKGDAAIIGISG